MERTVSKTVDLSSFRLDISEAQLLMSMMQEMHSQDHCRYRIDLRDGDVSYKFETPKDLNDSDSLPAKIHSFTLSVHSDTGHTSIYTHGGISRTKLNVDGSSGAWVAGASQEISEFVRKRRTWYHLLWSPGLGRAFWCSFTLLALLPVMLVAFPQLSDYKVPLGLVLLVIILWGLGGMSRHLLLPHSILEVRRKDSFLAKHGNTLTVIGGVVIALTTLGTLALTAYQIFRTQAIN